MATKKKPLKKPTIERAPRVKLKRLSAKDLVILFLTQGRTAVEQKLNAGQCTLASLKKAAERHPPMLDVFKAELTSKGRGRQHMTSGEERTYLAQQLDNGGVFLRLPLTVLGLKKGARMKVRVDGRRLIVEEVREPFLIG